MQNHANRDKYVAIQWNNINPAERYNFDKVSSYDYGNFGTSYDFK